MTSNPALHILRDVFGYAAFRGAQQAIVEHVAAGGDALVLMPTGGTFYYVDELVACRTRRYTRRRCRFKSTDETRPKKRNSVDVEFTEIPAIFASCKVKRLRASS